MTAGKQGETLAAELRGRGLRATPARIAVLRALKGSKAPRSHDEISRRVPGGYDRTTIFRTLSTLARVGLAHRADLGDRKWRFVSVVSDAATGTQAEVHGHFVCTGCKRILELRAVGVQVAQSRIPRSLREGRITVVVHGRCDSCGPELRASRRDASQP